MTPVRFGTDGIRGVAGQHPITAEVAVAVGAAAVRLGEVVVVGRDPRPSGAWLEEAVVSGVLGAGGVAVRAGVIPTSGVATALSRDVGDSGVMITASHNDAPDNGFKLFGPGGAKLDDADMARVEGWIAAGGRPAEGQGTEAVGVVRGAWLDALGHAAGDLAPLAGRRICVDLANGAAIVAADWLRRLPGAWTLVHAGDGVINDRCGAVHPESLAATVRDGGFDAGFAVDGDADRCVLVDERGVVVAGDALAWLLARGSGAATLAVTVMSTAAIEPSLPGVRVTRTPVGDRHLLAALAEGADLGCEESGHVVFRDGLPAGDGLLTALRALAMAWTASDRLSLAVAPFVPFPRRLEKVRVRETRDLAALDAVVRAGEARLGVGRVFLRYSGTEPVLRVLVEGRDEAVVARVAADVVAAAREVLG